MCWVHYIGGVLKRWRRQWIHALFCHCLPFYLGYVNFSICNCISLSDSSALVYILLLGVTYTLLVMLAACQACKNVAKKFNLHLICRHIQLSTTTSCGSFGSVFLFSSLLVMMGFIVLTRHFIFLLVQHWHKQVIGIWVSFIIIRRACILLYHYCLSVFDEYKYFLCIFFVTLMWAIFKFQYIFHFRWAICASSKIVLLHIRLGFPISNALLYLFRLFRI
jgi:hypothetical protein